MVKERKTALERYREAGGRQGEDSFGNLAAADTIADAIYELADVLRTQPRPRALTDEEKARAGLLP